MTLCAPSDCPLVAMLRPRSGQAQHMVSSVYTLQPWAPTTHYVDIYGNLCQRLIVPQGIMRMVFEVTMEVEADIAVAPDAPLTPMHQLPDDVLLYLLQSRYCPSDKMQEKARAIVGNAPPGYAQVEKIRAWIQQNLFCQYGVSSATTDAIDTMGHGAGVFCCKCDLLSTASRDASHGLGDASPIHNSRGIPRRSLVLAGRRWVRCTRHRAA